MTRYALVFALAALVSCRKEDGPPDMDLDGYTNDVDCDDFNAAVNPDASEVCDQIDQNCDGLVDNEASDATVWYGDSDADGYGNAEVSTTSCAAPPGSTATPADCDDGDPTRYPGAAETDCADPIDRNCDGSVGYADADEDGFAACQDCDDQNAGANADGVESCDGADNDCDGDVDEDVADAPVWYGDLDGDGHGTGRLTARGCAAPEGYVEDDDDCDDFAPQSFPGADEACDGKDNDCDGVVDNDPIDADTFYLDADGDGYGDDASPVEACEAPADAVARGGDCADADPRVHPYAPEVDCADPTDFNCDGKTGYADGDRDGFAACKDCDDTRSDVHVGGTETCDGADQDCDGAVDEQATDAPMWYADMDDDGVGGTRFSQRVCDAPEGYVPSSDDCDDLDPTSFPSGVEFCDGRDNDCDDVVDDDALDAAPFWPDADGDGAGDPEGASVAACEAPAGYAPTADDCDEARDDVFPGAPEDDCTDPTDFNCDGKTGYADADADGFAACVDCDDTNIDVNADATEVCNDIDDDCDGQVDNDAADATTWFRDADGDAQGAVSSTADACDAPSGYVSSSTDCDDLDRTAFVGGAEVCDGADDDCDGAVDDGVKSVFYRDADGDGYGDATSTTQACAAPAGYVANKLDCTDSNGLIHPGQYETCDGADNDCDGTTDEADAVNATAWYADDDNDGHGAGAATRACAQPTGMVASHDDCDDTTDAAWPGAAEFCDGIDNDCDGAADEIGANDGSLFFKDVDGDGYGGPLVVTACSQPTGYVATSTDCDDAHDTAYPGGAEVCDGLDNDCNKADDDGSAVGGGSSCAAASCAAIKSTVPTSTSKAYWLNPTTPYQAYCEMSVNGGGWTLAAKFANADARHWVTAKSNWTSSSTYGTTTNLAAGADAKGGAWGNLTATEFMLTDSASSTNYVATTSSCVGGSTLSSFFTTALASFPYGGDAWYKTCSVSRNYFPVWGAEPDWGYPVNSGGLSLTSNYLVIARTDASVDTSGVISLFATGTAEADLGLGAMENGATFEDSGFQQDVGGPTGCAYNDTECATEYPQTVFLWVK